MWEALGVIVAKLAIEFVDYFMTRKDITDKAKQEILIYAQERRIRADNWALTHDDPGKLPDRGGTIEINPSSLDKPTERPPL